MLEAVRPLTLPPEAEAIISQGTPKPQTQNPAVAIDSAKVQPAKSKSEKGREGENVAIVTATFRLPATIPPALLKASSERKIKKIQPFTQQDIVGEALTGWLQKHGYQI